MTSSTQSKLVQMESKYDDKSSVSDSEFGNPPPYTEAINHNIGSNTTQSPTFNNTIQLQIQASGIGCASLLGTRPDPIPVFRIDPSSSSSSCEIESQVPQYLSLRLKRSSNSCALVHGSDEDKTPIIATVYRWGPCRPPKIRFFPSSNAPITVEEAIGGENLDCEEVEVRNRSLLSRTQQITTPYGTFEWRYGSRAERKEAYGADSLLILEKIDPIAGAGAEEKHKQKRTRIAQLVRNAEFRTPGTSRCMAGNGGRLMLDLTTWAGEKAVHAEAVEAFAVASCICMLKREIDRMKNNQIAIYT